MTQLVIQLVIKLAIKLVNQLVTQLVTTHLSLPRNYPVPLKVTDLISPLVTENDLIIIC